MRRLSLSRARPVLAKAAPQPVSQALPAIGQTFNPSGLTKTFSHVFTAKPDIYHPTLNPGGKFGSTFVNRWRTKTEERGYYADSYVGHDPFSWDAGQQAVAIEMRPLTNTIKTAIQATGETVDTSLTPVVTGLINTAPSFSQALGVFEIVAKVASNSSGIWSAGWLTGKTWPPEADLFETPAVDTTKHTWNAHSGIVNPDFSVSNYVQHGPGENKAIATGNDFHRYSVLWTRNGLVYYRDGQEMGRFTNLPANFHDTPLWFIVSLQAGQPSQDSWLGALNTSMSPARLYLREFTAYRL